MRYACCRYLLNTCYGPGPYGEREGPVLAMELIAGGSDVKEIYSLTQGWDEGKAGNGKGC